jgi:hypothetical protein
VCERMVMDEGYSVGQKKCNVDIFTTSMKSIENDDVPLRYVMLIR